MKQGSSGSPQIHPLFRLPYLTKAKIKQRQPGDNIPWSNWKYSSSIHTNTFSYQQAYPYKLLVFERDCHNL